MLGVAPRLVVEDPGVGVLVEQDLAADAAGRAAERRDVAVVLPRPRLALRLVLGTEEALVVGAAVRVRGLGDDRHATLGVDDPVVRRFLDAQHGREILGAYLQVRVQQDLARLVGLVVLDVGGLRWHPVQRVQRVHGRQRGGVEGDRRGDGGSGRRDHRCLGGRGIRGQRRCRTVHHLAHLGTAPLVAVGPAEARELALEDLEHELLAGGVRRTQRVEIDVVVPEREVVEEGRAALGGAPRLHRDAAGFGARQHDGAGAHSVRVGLLRYQRRVGGHAQLQQLRHEFSEVGKRKLAQRRERNAERGALLDIAPQRASGHEAHVVLGLGLEFVDPDDGKRHRQCLFRVVEDALDGDGDLRIRLAVLVAGRDPDQDAAAPKRLIGRVEVLLGRELDGQRILGLLRHGEALFRRGRLDPGPQVAKRLVDRGLGLRGIDQHLEFPRIDVGEPGRRVALDQLLVRRFRLRDRDLDGGRGRDRERGDDPDQRVANSEPGHACLLTNTGAGAGSRGRIPRPVWLTRDARAAGTACVAPIDTLAQILA